MSSINFEYPLRWLPQQPRTKSPKRATFGAWSMARVGPSLVNELRLLGAKLVVITSNLQVRADRTGFLSNQRVDDAGIVVYFELKGKRKAMACDRWSLPEHNVRALVKSIEAIRGLERWGGSDFLDGLFTGFEALPAPDSVIVSVPSFFESCVDENDVRATYRKLSKELHPDVGGSVDEFSELQRQYKMALVGWK